MELVDAGSVWVSSRGPPTLSTYPYRIGASAVPTGVDCSAAVGAYCSTPWPVDGIRSSST
jgi:hypothetical protein